MLNIISRSIVSRHTRGPRKVVLNLIKGLDELNVPYVVNASLDATSELWIHDDPLALKASLTLPPTTSIIAGPNIYTLPSEIPPEMNLSRLLWLYPAPWVEKFWHAFGGSHIPSAVWPVGIDTAKFSPSTREKRLVLVYNKQRSLKDTLAVTTLLETLGQTYHVITYGNYQEREYQTLLSEAKAVIWIGRSESQGVGLLEALAMNVPMLVWGVTRFGDWVGSGHDHFTPSQLAYTPVMTAPYFNERCGVCISSNEELPNALPPFLSNLAQYTPRAYVEAELSLKRGAETFLALYTNHFGVLPETMRTKHLINTKKWHNATLRFQLKSQIKDALRRIIR